jgi:hypothetical protein
MASGVEAVLSSQFSFPLWALTLYQVHSSSSNAFCGTRSSSIPVAAGLTAAKDYLQPWRGSRWDAMTRPTGVTFTSTTSPRPSSLISVSGMRIPRELPRISFKRIALSSVEWIGGTASSLDRDVRCTVLRFFRPHSAFKLQNDLRATCDFASISRAVKSI